jgi:hypothetical protein
MRLLAVALVAWLLPLVAQGQASQLFGPGQPVVYHEEKLDRQFLRTRLAHALAEGSPDPNCLPLLGGMFTLLGEAAPRLHRRDQNFYLEPPLVQALTTQLSPGFPASTYFAEMVRRVLIDGQMPAEWLKVAQAVTASYALVDLAKLRYLADGPKLIDSLYVTLPLLVERHRVEVEQANASVADTAEQSFREAYLDHEVTFGGLTLVNLYPGKHGAAAEAVLELTPPRPTNPFLSPPNIPARRVKARLTARQYTDLPHVPRGTRMMVRGRLHDFDARMTRFELRDALLFEDRDFSRGVVLADPNVVARCPLARNDLDPTQAGGFAH